MDAVILLARLDAWNVYSLRKNKLSMYKNYKSVVLECLEQKKYPILLENVYIFLLCKFIKSNEAHAVENRFEYDPPLVRFEKANNEPFKLTYMDGSRNQYCLYRTDTLDRQKDCGKEFQISIDLKRSDVNSILNLKCQTFEEEIYKFISTLNFDVPGVRDLLGIEFCKSTRLVPLSIEMCVRKYVGRPIDDECVRSAEHFGPSGAFMEARMLSGRLSACASKTTLLSLNDATNFRSEAALQHYHPYNIHYSTRWRTFVPLAFNPLENPIFH